MAGGEPRVSHVSAQPEATGSCATRILVAGRQACVMPMIRLPLMRRLAGCALAAVLAPLLAILRGQLNPVTDGLAFAVIAVALLGGLTPAVFEAITGSLLLNFRFLPPIRTLTVAAANSAAALSVLIAVAVVVSLLAGRAVRHAGQAAAAIAAAGPIAEADRMRTALLAAVSHDLRTPIAAAKAAVSCLRGRDIQLTAEDHSELLATADESLDLLTHLVASLLDVSRLQAGALPVCPQRPISGRSLSARSTPWARRHERSEWAFRANCPRSWSIR
jgi:K+-sensing histidine kinase KdpD